MDKADGSRRVGAFQSGIARGELSSVIPDPLENLISPAQRDGHLVELQIDEVGIPAPEIQRP